MSKLLEKLLSSVSSTLKAPVCKTDVELDCRSTTVRIAEVGSVMLRTAGLTYRNTVAKLFSGARFEQLVLCTIQTARIILACSEQVEAWSATIGKTS